MKNRGKIFRFNLVILAITSATAASSAVIRESTQMDCPSMGRLHVSALIPAWRRKNDEHQGHVYIKCQLVLKKHDMLQ